jgi:lipid A disaccharide synthetase
LTNSQRASDASHPGILLNIYSAKFEVIQQNILLNNIIQQKLLLNNFIQQKNLLNNIIQQNLKSFSKFPEDIQQNLKKFSKIPGRLASEARCELVKGASREPRG